MIRNLFILVFAACLTGISRCDKDFGVENTAYDNFDAYDQYEGYQRMQYGDYDPSDRNEYEAGLNRNAEGGPNRSSESKQSGGVGRPPVNATNAAKVMSSKAGGANAKQVANKMQAKNNPKGAVATKQKVKLAAVMDPQKTNTKQTANTIPANISANGTNTTKPSKMTLLELDLPKKRLVTIQYYGFKQDEKNLYEEKDFPVFFPNRDIYIMVHGFIDPKDFSYDQESYVDFFFKSLSSAILSKYKANVVGMKWSFEQPTQPKPLLQYRAAIIAGKRLANAIIALRRKGLNPRLTIIGHDLGSMVAASLAGVLRRPVDYIYGLDQRLLPGQYRDFYLRQDSGRLVQTITTNGMKYNYGHRNFYPNGGNLSSAFAYEDQCFFCQSYTLLVDDLSQNDHDHSSTFCSNYYDYINDYCEHFPQVSYFNRFPAEQLPVGNYFITEDITDDEPLWTANN